MNLPGNAKMTLTKKDLIVKNFMTKNLFTVSENEPIAEAAELFENKLYRHLPVINDSNVLVGIISERDIRTSVVYSEFMKKNQGTTQDITIKMIMTQEPKTVSPYDSISRVSRILSSLSIGALPVLEGEELVGIITTTDLLNVLSSLIEKMEGE